MRSGLDARRARRPSTWRGCRCRSGNTSAEVGELFVVEGDRGDGHLVFEGDLRPVRAIGAGMASGRLTVRGDVGPRLALGMSGGAMTVEGSAGPWAGAEMCGRIPPDLGRRGRRPRRGPAGEPAWG